MTRRSIRRTTWASRPTWRSGSEAMALRLAHRGDWRRAPENTLAAFLAAIAVPGCDGLEFDVRASADGVPVVIHDETLKRVQGVDGRVDELSADALERHGVPSLADVLAAIPRRAFLDVELKLYPGRGVVDIVTLDWRGAVRAAGRRQGPGEGGVAAAVLAHHLLLADDLWTGGHGLGVQLGHRRPEVLLGRDPPGVLDDVLHVAAVRALELLQVDVELQLAAAVRARVGPGLFGDLMNRPLRRRGRWGAARSRAPRTAPAATARG